ncbi:MAG TPA: hypothetical protein VFQ96_06700, partial [Microbacteriaceae bacterium]|nr:hypothetical protein [Microbacteriaceae bacterium]
REALREAELLDILGPVPVARPAAGTGGPARAAGDPAPDTAGSEGLARLTVRFTYGQAAGVARVLRGLIVRAATAPRAAAGRGRRTPPTLKVRFDDPEAL